MTHNVQRRDAAHAGSEHEWERSEMVVIETF